MTSSTGLGPVWFAIHFDSLLIRNRINQLFAIEWITIHLPWIFDSQVNHDSRVNRDSRRNKIKPYQKFWFKMNKIKLNHESKWIVNQNESKSESNWITDIFFSWRLENFRLVNPKERVFFILQPFVRIYNFRSKDRVKVF